MTDEPLADPAVRVAGAREIAPDLLVIPDHRVALVPNIGIIGGTQGVLVVETGIGTANAEQVLALACEVAKGRRLYLTTTHFHPEHAFGAHVFAGHATYLANRAQADDLTMKGPRYLEMFRGFGGPIARRLDGVRLRTPDVVYDDGYDLNLGVRWLAVMDGLAGTEPRVVVPGHGDLGGPRVLADVRDYLRELRDETWLRRDSAMGQDEITAEVRALLIERHPEWSGREWIEPGVGCLHTEHAR